MPILSRFTAAAVAGCLLSAPLQAGDTRASLQYDPKELATPEGAAAVYKRLRLSAKRACEVPSAIQKRQEFECRREIEDDLVAQVDSPVILAIHENAERQLRMAQAN
ncbi:UrcA family protein [Erythrobacter gaetbuli]|uniref:UrcA family protein n=1 Tax=Qipengyuania gaetbuli TaxID=266952 RepID=A0A844Y4S2_9SPHN|nr:UrcA family protein [Qipengyuania gaetbuli]MXO52387.1 UrcA family protein [Qipengyuania gaetbuli]